MIVVTALAVTVCAEHAPGQTADESGLTRVQERGQGSMQLLDVRVDPWGHANRMRHFGPSTRQPLDAAIEDVGPLSFSLRRVEGGLQQPSGFDQVYRLPNSDRLARTNGALHAVFPRSLYASTQEGEVPLIPAGTTFYIGEPSEIRELRGPDSALSGSDFREAHLSAAQQHRVSLRSSAQVPAASVPAHSQTLRMSTQSDGVRQATNASQRAGRPQASGTLIIRAQTETLDVPNTMFGDEEYRRDRLRELLQRAARRAEQ